MSNLDQLIDQRRELAAKLAGKDLEIAMALGDRDAARRAMKEMNAQTIARQAASCFFVAQGDVDRQEMANA